VEVTQALSLLTTLNVVFVCRRGRPSMSAM